MSVPFTGGCICGAIKYECSAEPIRVAHCFCTDCQKLTGTQMSTNAIVPKSALKVTRGKPSEYSTTGDSGKKVKRFFCGTCGSPLWGEPEVMPDVAIIKVGSMDDSSWIQPGASIYVESKAAWAVVPQDIASFPKMPTG